MGAFLNAKGIPVTRGMCFTMHYKVNEYKITGKKIIKTLDYFANIH